MVKIDLIGKIFGRWIVLSQEKSRYGKIMWLCLCKCGNIKIVQGSSLKSGDTKSCGCIIKEASTSFGMRGTSTHNSWAGILQRCNNPKDKSYQGYGGRGITVCERWHKFKNFYEDMGKCPENLSIERVDNNKGYYPANCKWATRNEQQRNKRIDKKNTTGVNGVIINRKTGKYKVSIIANSKYHSLGTFFLLEDAIEARKQGEQKYWK